MKNKKESRRREDLSLLTAEELTARLSRELEKDRADSDQVRQLLRELRRRDAENPPAIPEAVEAVCQRYREKAARPEIPPAPKKSRILWQLGKIAAAAAVLCLVIFGVPRAFGSENLFTLVAHWTKDTFQFCPPGTTAAQEQYYFRTDNEGLQRVHDTVTNLGADVPVVPMWIPDGFELTEIKITDKAEYTKVCATLLHEDYYIILLININNQDEIEYPLFEKEGDVVETMEISSIAHYIMSNNDKTVAAWNNNRITCSISTNARRSMLEEMLTSIYWKG